MNIARFGTFAIILQIIGYALIWWQAGFWISAGLFLILWGTNLEWADVRQQAYNDARAKAEAEQTEMAKRWWEASLQNLKAQIRP